MNTANLKAVPVLSVDANTGFWFADGKAISLAEAIALAKSEAGCNYTSGAYDAMKVHLFDKIKAHVDHCPGKIAGKNTCSHFES